MGLHDLSKRNTSFEGKLIWQMYTRPDNKWCKIMQHKYLDNQDPSHILSISNPPNGSAIWNFMISSREVVVKFITWKVHSGNKSNFLLDLWNGWPPLSSFPIFRDSMLASTVKWRFQLVNYVSTVEIHLSKVVWKDFSDIPISDQERIDLNKALLERQVFLSNKDDFLIWAPSKDRRYSIKEGYKVIHQIDNIKVSHRAFSFCWNSLVLPKDNCFTWLALRNRILTSEKLEKLCITQSFK